MNKYLIVEYVWGVHSECSTPIPQKFLDFVESRIQEKFKKDFCSSKQADTEVGEVVSVRVYDYLAETKEKALTEYDSECQSHFAHDFFDDECLDTLFMEAYEYQEGELEPEGTALLNELYALYKA